MSLFSRSDESCSNLIFSVWLLLLDSADSHNSMANSMQLLKQMTSYLFLMILGPISSSEQIL